MELNIRQQEIVAKCLDNPQLMMKDLFTMFSVSKRTLYTDISLIKEWLNKNGIELSGSLLKIKYDEDRIWILKNLSQVKSYEVPLNQWARTKLILSILLFDEKRYTVREFCKEIGISRSTFYTDCEMIRKWLSEFKLKLIVSKVQGVEIFGEESKRRESMEFYLRQNFNDYDLLGSLMQRQTAYELDSLRYSIYQKVKSYFDEVELDQVVRFIHHVEEEKGFQFIDSCFIPIVWIFAIGLTRVKNGDVIKKDYPQRKKEDSKERLLDLLSFVKETELREKEMNYLLFYIDLFAVRYMNIDVQNQQLDFKILKFIDEISLRLGVDLVQDQQLFESLKEHLYSMQQRIHLGGFELNPIKEKLIERFSDLFIICDEAVKKVGLIRDFTEDELSYLVLYTAAALERTKSSNKRIYVVCTTGRGSSELLMMNLMNRFPELNILGSISIEQASLLTLEDTDAVISTIYFKNKKVPIFVVSPLLLQEDILKIKQFFEINFYIEESTSGGTRRKEDFFEMMYLMSDCTQVIKNLCEDLKKQVSNDVFMGMVIHLMMRLHQRDELSKVKKINKITEKQKKIKHQLEWIYKKYECKLSDYDIRSIQMYFEVKDDN